MISDPALATSVVGTAALVLRSVVDDLAFIATGVPGTLGDT